jgi:hypothetical protein
MKSQDGSCSYSRGKEPMANQAQKDSKRREIMAKKPTAKKLTDTQKYRQLKAQTEAAGMKVEEVDGKIVVRRKK